jgi:hypothetical protein
VILLARFEPIFQYYPLADTQIVVRIDPQDGSSWPYHFLVYCEYNETTGQWDLYQNEKVALNISKPDKDSAIREACLQLVQRQNTDIKL